MRSVTKVTLALRAGDPSGALGPRKRREVLDGLASFIRKTKALGVGRARDRSTTRLHAAPLPLAVDEHATIAKHLVQHGGAALHVAERDELQPPAQVWLKALTQPL